MSWKSNVATKKGKKWLYDCFRTTRACYEGKPLIINSLPKSGTHLLYQIVAPLGLKDLGGFLASTPSFTMKEIAAVNMALKLAKLYNQEIISSHMFFDCKVENVVRELNIPMIFIYRDPRDVFLSEINYLTNMNRWHKLHSYYDRCRNFNEKFELCLNGVETNQFYYPRFSERVEKYINWIKSDVCISVSFEKLRSESQIDQEIAKLADYFIKQSLWFGSVDDFVIKARASIKPELSHTFSGGKVNRWKDELSAQQQEQLNRQLVSQISDMDCWLS